MPPKKKQQKKPTKKPAKKTKSQNQGNCSKEFELKRNSKIQGLVVIFDSNKWFLDP